MAGANGVFPPVYRVVWEGINGLLSSKVASLPGGSAPCLFGGIGYACSLGEHAASRTLFVAIPKYVAHITKVVGIFPYSKIYRQSSNLPLHISNTPEAVVHHSSGGLSYCSLSSAW